MSGILGATFSLYAEDLGASVVFIGLLTSMTGLVGLVSSVPIGVASDRVGRIRVLTFGMSGFALSMALFAVAPSPAFLIPGRLLLGAAMVASFWIAAAYLGDIVAPSERGLAFGLLTTSMGLGFAVGPLVGGLVAEWIDIRAAYALGALVGVAGVAVVVFVLRGRQSAAAGASRPRISVRESLRVGRERRLIAAGIANVLTAIAFGGAVATFFPLYGRELGISDAAIGTMFAIRAIASTCVRLPSGALTGILGSRQMVLGAIAIGAIAIAGIGTADSYGPLLGWLVLEGIGYGAFLTSAQAYMAENTVEATRGAAIGFYSMSGGIGNTLAPLILGIVANVFGLVAVFYACSAAVAVGLVVICWIWIRLPAPTAVLGRTEGPVYTQEGISR
jgi:MFS transporter, DHA1 family, multidrug resistance protein